jgi:hypothetical protein
MTFYCAIPPLDQAATRIGRGYGLGYNRERTRMDQMHAGFDFVADSGTPVVAPIPGTVATKSDDTGPGYQRRFRGYGNSLVLEHRFAVPGLPNPFFTLYAHLRDPVRLEVGQRVNTSDLLGIVGNTTNGQFSGMGPHLHSEVRRAPVVAYGSRRDTFDPAVLWDGLGFAWIDNHREAERLVGGQLLLREGGPSDCRAGQSPTIAGLVRLGLAAPPGLIDPSTLRSKYVVYGGSRSNQNISSPALMPPDYAAVNSNAAVAAARQSGSMILPAVAGGAAVLGLWWLSRR